MRGATVRRGWSGDYARRITAECLRLHHDDSLGYAPCQWCGGKATTADHYPIGRDEGGSDTQDNLVPACRPCNSTRGAAYTNAKRANEREPAPSRDW